MPYALRSKGPPAPPGADPTPAQPAPAPQEGREDDSPNEIKPTLNGLFGGLPSELIRMVVTDGSLASLGLLNLSQVNKFFYYYLRDRKKMHWLWAAVRDKEWPGYCCNPYTLRVSEVKMVHLIQGTNCCRCGSSDKPTILNRVHLLRLCPDCKSFWLTLRQAWRIDPDLHPLTALCCRQRSSRRFGQDATYWLPELRAVSAKLYALEDEPLVPDPDRPGEDVPSIALWIRREEKRLEKGETTRWREKLYDFFSRVDEGKAFQ